MKGESKDKEVWCSLKSKWIDATHKVTELHHEVNEVKDGELYTQVLTRVMIIITQMNFLTILTCSFL